MIEIFLTLLIFLNICMVDYSQPFKINITQNMSIECMLFWSYEEINLLDFIIEFETNNQVQESCCMFYILVYNHFYFMKKSHWKY